MAGVEVPPLGFHFQLQMVGSGTSEVDAAFMEISGIEATVDYENVSEGGANNENVRLPKGVSYSNLVLKRGLATSSDLVDWLVASMEGFSFIPQDLQISLLDDKHDVQFCWQFFGALPVKWAVSDFNASSSNVVVETLELNYRYFRQQKP